MPDFLDQRWYAGLDNVVHWECYACMTKTMISSLAKIKGKEGTDSDECDDVRSSSWGFVLDLIFDITKVGAARLAAILAAKPNCFDVVG